MEIEKIKNYLMGAALGAFALFGVGFGMSGWVLGGTAQERAGAAVVERLAPICVAQFKQDPTKDKKIKALQKLEYSKQEKFVENQGWATMPGEKKPDSAVAKKCGELITG
jgi:hypothetical protein